MDDCLHCLLFTGIWDTELSNKLNIIQDSFLCCVQVDVDGSGYLEFPEFCTLMYKKLSDTDMENELKETFRVFSKDNEGIN